MTITLPSDLEQALAQRAQERDTTPEQVALDTLRQGLLPSAPSRPEADVWIARLKQLAIPAGVSLPEESLSREALYD